MFVAVVCVVDMGSVVGRNHSRRLLYEGREEAGNSGGSRTSSVRKRPTKTGTSDKLLYTLEVFLVSGPITEKFAKENPVVSRTIQIRGDQTLEELHGAIFKVFDREEEHMYEFQFGKGPHDPKGKRYVLPMELEGPFSHTRGAAGDVVSTAIVSLDLKVGQALGYWFDFGDDWCHQINVVAIEHVSKGKYPKVTKRVGESPPQYIGSAFPKRFPTPGGGKGSDRCGTRKSTREG